MFAQLGKIAADKAMAETKKCGCCGKTPCTCAENCSCGCKSKSAAAKPGLWANIHAKKERGETVAKPGDKDYPDAKNWKKVTNESEKKALFGFGAKKKPGMTIEEASKLIDPMLLARAAMVNELFEASKDPTGKAVKQKFRNPKFRQSFFEGMTPEMYDVISVVNEKKASPAWQTSEGKSESGGLNDKGRASLKAQGHDIKRPQPEGGPRKDSFCARMKGMKAKLTSNETARDPDSRINKSLRKWKCGSTVEKLAFLMKTAKCWQGYERVPGTKAMTPGSCRPVPNKAPNSTETKQPEVKKAAIDKKKDKEPERKSWTKPLVIGGGLLGSALLGAAAMAGRRVASPGTGGVMTRRAIIEGVKHLVNDKTKQDTSNPYYSKMGY